MENDIIFICHGNVNRSRAAEEIMKQLRPDLKIDSYAVGVGIKHGRLITKKMREILVANGFNFNIESRSKIVEVDNIRSAKIAFLMDSNNLKHLKLRFNTDFVNIKMLGDVCGCGTIKDPGFSKGTIKYEECFKQILDSCKFISENYDKL